MNKDDRKGGGDGPTGHYATVELALSLSGRSRFGDTIKGLETVLTAMIGAEFCKNHSYKAG